MLKPNKGLTTSDAPKAPDRQICALCSYQFWYPTIKQEKPKENHIIGRSANGGYICRNCYEQGEHSHHVARDEFLERHQGDMWQSLYSAAHGLDTKEDKIDMLKLLRKQLTGGLGLPLPYNPAASAAEIDAGTDAINEERIHAMKERTRASVEAYMERRRT